MYCSENCILQAISQVTMSKDTKVHTTPKNANDMIEALRRNDESVLKALYIENYQKIERLVLKNKGTKEQAKDIYQEAFITVWKNVKADKFFPENNSAINGYLYAIAKNKWMDYLGSSAYKKTLSYDQIATNPSFEVPGNPSMDAGDHEHKLSLAMHAFKKMDDGCKLLLTKFYFEKKSMKEIARELSLDPASTRNKKYRCMQSLRKLALEMSK